MEYVKRGLTGYVPCKAEERCDELCVLLTAEEYKRLANEMAELRQKLNSSEDRYTAILLEKEKETQRELELLDLMHRKSLGEQVARTKEAVDERDRQAELNKNLLRICKERANSERKIPDKKGRSGYMMAGTREVSFRQKNGDYADAWETTLRTPWTYNMTPENVRTALSGETALLKILGIEKILDTKLQLGRDGFWEIRLRHPEPVREIPEDLRPF